MQLQLHSIQIQTTIPLATLFHTPQPPYRYDISIGIMSGPKAETNSATPRRLASGESPRVQCAVRRDQHIHPIQLEAIALLWFRSSWTAIEYTNHLSHSLGLPHPPWHLRASALPLSWTTPGPKHPAALASTGTPRRSGRQLAQPRRKHL